MEYCTFAQEQGFSRNFDQVRDCYKNAQKTRNLTQLCVDNVWDTDCKLKYENFSAPKQTEIKVECLNETTEYGFY